MRTEYLHRLKFEHESTNETPFCTFRLVESGESEQHPHLIADVLSGAIDGFVARGLFSPQEVADVLQQLDGLQEDLWMKTPFGKNFPKPFATINDKNVSLDQYFQKLDHLNQLKSNNAVVGKIFERLDEFLRTVGADFNVSVPKNDVKHAPVVPGTFRFMMPNLGGLFIHCGNLFQQQSQFFYSMLEGDVDMDNQLSYFIVLQNADQGGELTLYDMLWKDVQRKDHPENNEYVLDKDGNRIYISDMHKATVRPEVGDILVFHGGPIWHRVEDIIGAVPRITLGGFLNFSHDRKDVFYWS